MSARLMHHTTDPADDIRRLVSDYVDEIDILFNQVLIGVYKRPEKTASGLYLADSTRDEDDYQGKIGLVLKKGPDAFQENADAGRIFNGQDVQVGDWVAIRTSDGWSLKLGSQLCRVVSDTHIRAIVKRPDILW